MFALKTNKVSATEALRHGVMVLQEERIESASLDARILLQFVLNVSREGLLLNSDIRLSAEQDAQYRELIEKRSRRQPVSQLIGKREFWGMDFKTSENTLDPRGDSETVVEMLLNTIKNHSAPLKTLDLGTGTGCLLLALLKELPNATGTGVDISNEALEIARDNARQLGFASRTSFIESCWGEKVDGTFDVIVANPPYILTETIPTLEPEVSEFEPMVALDGGKDGLDHYRVIVSQLPRLLAKDGVAGFEIGMGQEEALKELAAENGLRISGMKMDLAGITRAVTMKHKD